MHLLLVIGPRKTKCFFEVGGYKSNAVDLFNSNYIKVIFTLLAKVVTLHITLTLVAVRQMSLELYILRLHEGRFSYRLIGKEILL